jgi:hypothetical protein
MNYKDISVSELCFYLIDRGDPLKFHGWIPYTEFRKLEMIEFIKVKTDNFDLDKFKYFMLDLRGFDMPFINEKNEVSSQMESMGWDNTEEDPNTSLLERIDMTAETLLHEVWHHKCIIKPLNLTKQLIQFSNIAETEYKRVTESMGFVLCCRNTEYCENAEYKRITTATPNESEYLTNRQTNLNRRQKIALLECLGVMKYLDQKFSSNQTQTAKFLSMIIECSEQNIRTDINKDTTQLLIDPRIRTVIDPILTDLGLKSKE